MQRIKDQGLDPAKPAFSNESSFSPQPETDTMARPVDIVLTNPDVNRKVTAEELEAHAKEGEAWFVVQGEVWRRIISMQWRTQAIIGHHFRFSTLPVS